MRDDETGQSSATHALKERLIAALEARRDQNQPTALRDLHTLLDQPQSVALRIAHELEHEGVLRIAKESYDTFGSAVDLTSCDTGGFEALKNAWRSSLR
ncbi:MAG: hypothetical protein AAF692_11995 [Pseudomonadota bacterium]